MSTEEILDTRHFSQVTIDLIKERTYGANFTLTGSQGLGKGYSRIAQYLLTQRILANLSNPLMHDCR